MFIVLLGAAFVGVSLIKLASKLSYNAGYEKGRAESTVVVVSSGSNLPMVLFVLGFLAFVVYLLQ
jgi:hypothetical protein